MQLMNLAVVLPPSKKFNPFVNASLVLECPQIAARLSQNCPWTSLLNERLDTGITHWGDLCIWKFCATLDCLFLVEK